MADIGDARNGVGGVLGETARRIDARAAAGAAVTWPGALDELGRTGEERLGVAVG